MPNALGAVSEGGGDPTRKSLMPNQTLKGACVQIPSETQSQGPPKKKINSGTVPLVESVWSVHQLSSADVDYTKSDHKSARPLFLDGWGCSEICDALCLSDALFRFLTPGHQARHAAWAGVWLGAASRGEPLQKAPISNPLKGGSRRASTT